MKALSRPAIWRKWPCRQRGGVAIMFGLSLILLVGFIGLAVDVGRFFVIKSELQNAMDACALSAASQLKPGENDPSALTRAVAYGRVFTTGGVPSGTLTGFPLDAIKNKANFQSSPVALANTDISFSATLNGTYETNTAAYNTARFVKCEYPLAGLPIYFMGVLNLLGANYSTQTVRALAVATRGPQICNVIPVGICGTSASDYGLTKGNWIPLRDSPTKGQFSWAEFDGPGASILVDALTNVGKCDIPVGAIGNPVNNPGKKTSAELGWNSRFGLYRNGAGNPQKDTASPDFTGYAYFNTTDGDSTINWPRDPSDALTVTSPRAYDGVNASATTTLNFQSATAIFSPFDGTTSLAGYASQRLVATDHQIYGRNRRLVAAPIVDCSNWTVRGFACALMLSPFSSGGGVPASVGKLEYLGPASDPNSPCGANVTGPNMSLLVK